MADNSQDLIQLGLDISSFSPEKKVMLTDFILLFEKLQKFDKIKVSPILGEGLASFNQSVIQSTKLIDELNAKMNNLGNNVNSVNSKNSKSFDNLTDRISKQEKEIIDLKTQVAELTKELMKASSAQDSLTNSQRKSSAASKELESDYKKLKQAARDQSEIYANLFLSKGKNDPATQAALAQFRATSSTINDIEKRIDAGSSAAGRFGRALAGPFGVLRNIAYILPGLGIAGIFNLAFEAIGNAAEALGLFNNNEEEAIKFQTELNKAMLEFNKIVADYEKALQSPLGLTQSQENDLAYAKALNKSKLDQLNLEKELIENSSLKSNQRFFREGGFQRQEEAYKKLTMAEYELERVRKSFINQTPNDKNLLGDAVFNKDTYELQLNLAQSSYDLAKDNFVKIKSINEQNASDLQKSEAKTLEIKTFIEEEKRKLVLETAKLNSKNIIDYNRIILADDRSTFEQRIASIKAISEAEKSASEAQKRYILSRPDSVNADGSLTTDANVAKKSADQSIIESERKKLEELEKVNIQYYQRLIKAKTEIDKDEVDKEAIKNEKIFNNETNSFEDRIVAYNNYLIARQKLQLLEEARDLQRGASKKGGRTSLTEEESDAIVSSSLKNRVNLQADAEKRIYDIVSSSMRRQLNAIKDENSFETRENVRHYIDELEALNKSFENKKISYKRYSAEREKIDKEYRTKVLDEQIKDDNEDIQRLKNKLYNDIKLQQEAKKRLDSAEVELKFTKDSGEGDVNEAQKEYDISVGQSKAIADAIIETQKEIEKAQKELDKDELERAKRKYDQLIQYQKEYAANNRLIVESLYQFAKGMIDAEYDAKIQRSQEANDQFQDEADRQRDAIENSSLSAKEKAALDIQLSTEKMVADKNAQAEEKRLKRENAEIDRALALAKIGWSTAEAVMAALSIPPPAGEILAAQRGIIGAIQAATVIATPIPSFAEGVENFVGGEARYAEAGPEILEIPGQKPKIVWNETVSYLPPGTNVIPLVDNFDYSYKMNNDGWEQTRWLASQYKKSNRSSTSVNNVININLGFEEYKRNKLFGY